MTRFDVLKFVRSPLVALALIVVTSTWLCPGYDEGPEAWWAVFSLQGVIAGVIILQVLRGKTPLTRSVVNTVHASLEGLKFDPDEGEAEGNDEDTASGGGGVEEDDGGPQSPVPAILRKPGAGAESTRPGALS